MPRIALELLRLLAADAPAEQIEEKARALAAEDPDDGEAARELALRVRAGLDAHRRREAELSALVDTARDLASMPDPGDVLDAIVRRARTLLRADVAYLTLYDPDRGDTYMRATAGSVSARFQALRLPLGAGLGGLVAQTRRPYWSADYPADEQFRHTSEIDAAVDDEGLIGICGTPLLVGDEFVGVLFASQRTRRAFHHDEVALLGSLAALAAVSLVQSRRAAATAATLAALSTAHEGIAQAAAAHDRFVGVVLAGGGVDDIAAVLGEVLACWVAVLDVDGSRLAAHGPVPGGSGGSSVNGNADGPADPLADAPAVRRSAETGRLAEADGMWAVAVTAAGQRLGTLVLGGRDGFDAGQGRTVERAAMVTALVLAFRLRAAETDQRVRTDLLTELLGRTPGPEQTTVDRGLVERGRVLGLRLNTPHVLAVCRCDGSRRRGVAARRECARATVGRWSPSTATASSCCCPAATPPRSRPTWPGGPAARRAGRSPSERAGRSRRPAASRPPTRRRSAPRTRSSRWGSRGTAGRPATSGSPGWCSATARTSRATWTGCSDRCWTTTTAGAATSSARWRRISQRGRARAGPRARCTCTSTRSASVWTG